MNPDPNPERRHGWLWWICGAAFLVGAAAGVRETRIESTPLPIPHSIPQLEKDDIKLDHPLTGEPLPADRRGNLRFWLYAGRDLAEPPLAEEVQPPAFDGSTQWLKTLVDEKIHLVPRSRSIRMRGYVTFSAAQTLLHLRSENGYRIRFRNALDVAYDLAHWQDDVTWDSAYAVAVEPGRYEIEIDYFCVGGYGMFEIWGTPEVQFDPAPDRPAAP